MNKKMLPLGFFTRKQWLINKVVIILGIILGTLFIGVWVNLLKQHFITGILLFFVVFFIVFLFTITKSNPIRGVLNKLDVDADINGFKATVNEMLNNNLHPETEGFLKIILVNALYVVNFEEAFSLFETIKKPTTKQYINIYDSVELLYYFNKEQYEEFRKLLDVYKINYPNNPNCQALDRLDIIHNTTNSINDIEALYPYNTDKKFLNLLNMQILMFYYDKRENKELANKYAKLLLENAIGFNELIKDANKVMGGV